jgi:TonB-linked SusC/RagA family outer membrane protein
MPILQWVSLNVKQNQLIMSRKFSLMCFLFGFVFSVWAQDRVVTGRVTSKEDGSPLPGVNVVLKGTTNGTITNNEGKYSVSIPTGGGVLSFSFIGMEAQEFEIGARSVIDVSLNPDVTQLSEVVVTGALGLVKQAKELGYAASTVTAKELTQAKAIDVGQSLNGKVSGLNITTANSGVFQNYKINIRGIRSLTGNNQPMLIVDGAQVPLATLSQISPEDIEHTDFLKSSASAALYGPDAVNGVIVITTKRGRSNQAPVVNFSTTAQVTRVAYFPKLQHAFGQGAGEVVDQYGNYGYVSYENQLYGPRYDGTTKQIGVTLPDGSYQEGPYSSLHKNDKVNFWNSGSTIQYAASITGSDYFLSIQDADIKGLMPQDKNHRTTVRINGDKKIGKFSAAYGLGYTMQKADVVNENGLQTLFSGAYSGSIMFSVMQTADNIPLLSFQDQNSKWAKYSNWYNEFALPPYWIINNLRSHQNTGNLIANATLGYEITPWLKATARMNVNIFDSRAENVQNPLTVDDWTTSGPLARNSVQFFNAKGSVFEDNAHTSLWNVDYFLNGKKNAGSFNVSYLVGGNYRETNERDVAVQGNNLVVPYLNNVSVRSGPAILPTYQNPNGPLIPYSSQGNYNYVLLARRSSAYGTMSVGYKDWAFAELTGRNDWDSRLVASNRSFFYPGANISVVLSDAISALKTSTFSFLKVRGAVSKSANVNLSPYQLAATYSQPAGFPFGNTVGFTANNTIPAVNLKPETITSKEVGLEVGFLNGKFDIEATYFDQQCNDQILTTSLPWSSGYSAGIANAASFNNRGFEFDFGVAPYQVGKGRISFKMNATYNNSKISSTPGGAPVVIGGTGNFIQVSRNSPTANNIAQQGGPAFQFQLSDYDRDPATGKVIIDPITGNPSLSTNLTITGRTLPVWIMGFTPKYEIGGLAVSMTWDYKTGHQFYSGLGSDMDFAGISARSASYGRQRFVFPNSVYKGSDGQYHENTNIQVQDGNYGFWTGSGTNTGIATNYFASATAIRLREVNITYNLPTKWLSPVKFIKKASISLVGRNLILLVPKSNQWGDPEFNYSTANNSFGLGSAFQTPASRLYGGNLSLTF